MIVKCTKIRAEGNNYDYQFLTVGESYSVYGIIHDLNNQLNFLITTNRDSIPFYAPSDLFIVQDGTIPSSFKAAIMSFPDGRSRSVISYDELSTYKHHKGLIEQDDEQLKVFFERKKQIDEELTADT